MASRCFLLLLLLAFSAAAIADDAAVYETFSGVQIGRVFLSPGDRERLDARRLHPPAEHTAGEPEAEGGTKQPRSLAAAGYIISSSGQARVWRDGDFVESPQRAPQRITFPGDIRVTRTVPEEDARNADTEDQRERPSETDGDAD